MGLNCGYACELVGILKITTMGLLCISLCLLIYATGDADIYADGIEGLEKQCKDKREKARMQGIQLPPCPEKWMGYVAFIFLICCVIFESILVIPPLLCASINGNMLFKQIDCIYHIGAALALFLGGSFTFTFGILALVEEPCNNGSGFERVSCENERGSNYHSDLHVLAGVLMIMAAMTSGFAGIKMHNSSTFPEVTADDSDEVGRNSI